MNFCDSHNAYIISSSPSRANSLQAAPAVDASVMPKDSSGLPDADYKVPSLSEMGYPETAAPVRVCPCSCLQACVDTCVCSTYPSTPSTFTIAPFFFGDTTAPLTGAVPGRGDGGAGTHAALPGRQEVGRRLREGALFLFFKGGGEAGVAHECCVLYACTCSFSHTLTRPKFQRQSPSPRRRPTRWSPPPRC